MGLKIISISKWDDENTGLTHYATTWQVSDSPDFQNVLLEEPESETFLDTWEVNLAIPTGEVYYVRAKRHFKDSEGNVVENDIWLGPEPLIEASEIKIEPLKPSVYVEDPYVEFVSLDAENGLKLRALEPKDGIGVVSVDWTIKADGKTVYSIMDKTEDPFVLIVSNDVYNFTAAEEIEVLVRYNGKLGVSSRLYKDKIELTKRLFHLDVDLSNFPLNENTLVNIISDSDIGVTVYSPVLITTLDNKVIAEAQVLDGNKLDIPASYLKPNTSYKISIPVSYVDPVENVKRSTEVVFYIKTAKASEAFTINPDYEYKNRFVRVGLVDPKDFDIKPIPQHTEQPITGTIPMLDYNGRIDLKLLTGLENGFGLSSIKKLFDYDSEAIKFEFLPYNRLLVFRKPIDKDPVMELYEFDPYKDELKAIKTNVIFPQAMSIIERNPTFILDDKFGFGIVNEGSLELNVIDKDGNIETVKTLTLPGVEGLRNVTLSQFDYDTLMIVPEGGTVPTRSIVYDFNKDDLFLGPVIPEDFRNKPLTNNRLINGNIIYFKLDTPDDFMVYNRKTHSFDITLNDLTTENNWIGSIKLKSGRLLKYLIDSDGKINFYLYE